MTTDLKQIHREIEKEYKRIEMLRNSTSNGVSEWHDFVVEETKKAKAKIKELNKQFNNN